MLKTVKLEGTATGVSIGQIGHGLMMMTQHVGDDTIPDEVAFEAIKAGIDAVPAGAKGFINSGEFYGPGFSVANLELVARFFDKYPTYADRVFLSVKGGTIPGTVKPDGSEASFRRSIDVINAALRGTKKVDLFEPARFDRRVPAEEQVRTLAALVAEGKFDHIGLSEVSAETLRKAHAVHPIAAVEIEVSLMSYEEETRKVIATARELGVAVIAYSPVARGLLSGKIRCPDDLPKDDVRRFFTRFQEENIAANSAFVDALVAIAKRKNVTLAQLALAWVASLGPHVVPLPGSSHKTRTLENIGAGDVDLTQADLAEIDGLLKKYEIKGGRYIDGANDLNPYLWG